MSKFTFRKSTVLDDAAPVAPSADRIFTVPLFSSGGKWNPRVVVDGKIYPAGSSTAITPSSFKATLWLEWNAVWTAIVPTVSVIPGGQTAMFEFGPPDAMIGTDIPRNVDGFIQIETIVAVGGDNAVFEVETTPFESELRRGPNGEILVEVSASALPAGAATSALQSSVQAAPGAAPSASVEIIGGVGKDAAPAAVADGTTVRAWLSRVGGAMGVITNVAGTAWATVKAASTAAAFTDQALVTDLRPGGVLPAASAAADGAAAETSTSIRARLEAYNNATWDRLRSGVTAIGSTFTGYLTVLPWALYRAAQTVHTDGQGGPLETDELGNLRSTLRSYDTASGANKEVNVSDLNQQYVEETLIDTTNVAGAPGATNYYPSSAGMPMAGYKDFSVQAMIGGGVTMTIEVTLDDAASPDWLDVTMAGYNPLTNAVGAASLVDTNGILDFDNLNVRAVRIKSVTSDASNNVQYNVRRKAL